MKQTRIFHSWRKMERRMGMVIEFTRIMQVQKIYEQKCRAEKTYIKKGWKKGWKWGWNWNIFHLARDFFEHPYYNIKMLIYQMFPILSTKVIFGIFMIFDQCLTFCKFHYSTTRLDKKFIYCNFWPKFQFFMILTNVLPFMQNMYFLKFFYKKYYLEKHQFS